MNNRRIFYSVLLASLGLASCSKTPAVPLNLLTERYFNAWVEVHEAAYPGFEWKETELGSYILMETQTSGQALGNPEEHPFVAMEYTKSNLGQEFVESMVKGVYLCGDVLETSNEQLSRQMGTYSDANYYGPVIWKRSDNALAAGIDEVLSTMRMGERRYFITPGWLQTTKRFSTAEGYKLNCSGTDLAFDMTLKEIIPDIVEYQLDSMKHYMARNYPKKDFADSMSRGCYYIRTKEPVSEEPFTDGSQFYINYTGRLLNGKVFDTTIADTAKVYGIYDPTKKYEPQKVTWSSKPTGLTLGAGGSTVIAGFSMTLQKMFHYEKGTGIFYSSLGYGADGSGVSIPGYSPLVFEFETMDEKE